MALRRVKPSWTFETQDAALNARELLKARGLDADVAKAADLGMKGWILTAPQDATEASDVYIGGFNSLGVVDGDVNDWKSYLEDFNDRQPDDEMTIYSVDGSNMPGIYNRNLQMQ